MKGSAFMLVFLSVTSFISYSQAQKNRQNKNLADTDDHHTGTITNHRNKDTSGIHHYDLNKNIWLE